MNVNGCPNMADYSYSFHESVGVICTYGRAVGNSCVNSRPYQETFLDQNHPNHQTFAAVYRRLPETASVAHVIANGGRSGVFFKHDFTKHVLEGFAGDPDGMRQLTAAFSVGYITVC